MADPTDHHARLARELDLAGVKPCFAAADVVVARPGVVLAALVGAHGRDEVLRAMGGSEASLWDSFRGEHVWAWRFPKEATDDGA